MSPDAAMAQALDLVARTHLLRDRLCARRAWSAACAAAGPGAGGVAPGHGPAAFARELPEPLGRLLDGLAPPGAAGRDAARARLLRAVLRSADRWSSAWDGAQGRRVVASWRGSATPTRPQVAGHRHADGRARVAIRRLAQTAPSELAAELARLRAAGPIRELVLDLRGNTGGSYLAAARVAASFLPRAALVAGALDLSGRPVPGLTPRVVATEDGDLSTRLTVLVDARTASSAELLAASLQRHGRARLAGQRTFGKTVLGTLRHVDAGGADLTLRITSARMLAAGEPLPAGGLVPEVALPVPADSPTGPADAGRATP